MEVKLVKKKNRLRIPINLERRLELNLRNTGHPFYHKTADGTIVEPDPTLEYLLSIISAVDRELIIKH
jgi:hypothetical protein